MANTRRELTASFRSEDVPYSAESSPIPALGFSPHYSTPVYAVCQEFNHLKLRIREPMISCIASAVDISYDSHSKTHGSTVSLIYGNMVGQKLYSVSIYPDRTIELWTPPTRQQLFSFALANLDLLLKPAHALGSFLNDWTLTHELDVVVLSSDCDTALDLGLRSNQKSIYSLELRQVIAVPRPPHEPIAKLAGVGND
jgi:hypothetical protein